MITNSVKRGDIVFYDFGTKPGSDNSGLRPALVLQHDKFNTSSPTTIIAPIVPARKRKMCAHILLEKRFGLSSYKTGAWFFFISKLLGASVRLFLVCLILQLLVFGPLGLPFLLNVAVTMGIVLIYTFRGGVKSVIWTDNLKTFCMIASEVLCIVFIAKGLGLDFKGLASAVSGSGMSRVFFFMQRLMRLLHRIVCSIWVETKSEPRHWI